MTDSTILNSSAATPCRTICAFSPKNTRANDWQAHSNIHGMANMWLQRHDMFRELGGMLTAAIGDYREEQH